MELGSSPAVLEKLEIFLPFLVFESMLSLAFQLVNSLVKLKQEKFFAFYPFPDDIKF
jgi:hypothetical protein